MTESTTAMQKTFYAQIHALSVISQQSLPQVDEPPRTDETPILPSEITDTMVAINVDQDFQSNETVIPIVSETLAVTHMTVGTHDDALVDATLPAMVEQNVLAPALTEHDTTVMQHPLSEPMVVPTLPRSELDATSFISSNASPHVVDEIIYTMDASVECHDAPSSLTRNPDALSVCDALPIVPMRHEESIVELEESTMLPRVDKPWIPLDTSARASSCTVMAQEPSAQEPLTQELSAQELSAQEPSAQEPLSLQTLTISKQDGHEHAMVVPSTTVIKDTAPPLATTNCVLSPLECTASVIVPLSMNVDHLGMPASEPANASFYDGNTRPRTTNVNSKKRRRAEMRHNADNEDDPDDPLWTAPRAKRQKSSDTCTTNQSSSARAAHRRNTGSHSSNSYQYDMMDEHMPHDMRPTTTTTAGKDHATVKNQDSIPALLSSVDLKRDRKNGSSHTPSSSQTLGLAVGSVVAVDTMVDVDDDIVARRNWLLLPTFDLADTSKPTSIEKTFRAHMESLCLRYCNNVPIVAEYLRFADAAYVLKATQRGSANRRTMKQVTDTLLDVDAINERPFYTLRKDIVCITTEEPTEAQCAQLTPHTIQAYTQRFAREDILPEDVLCMIHWDRLESTMTRYCNDRKIVYDHMRYVFHKYGHALFDKHVRRLACALWKRLPAKIRLRYVALHQHKVLPVLHANLDDHADNAHELEDVDYDTRVTNVVDVHGDARMHDAFSTLVDELEIPHHDDNDELVGLEW